MESFQTFLDELYHDGVIFLNIFKINNSDNFSQISSLFFSLQLTRSKNDKRGVNWDDWVFNNNVAILLSSTPTAKINKIWSPSLDISILVMWWDFGFGNFDLFYEFIQKIVAQKFTLKILKIPSKKNPTRNSIFSVYPGQSILDISNKQTPLIPKKYWRMRDDGVMREVRNKTSAEEVAKKTTSYNFVGDHSKDQWSTQLRYT